MRFVTGAKNYIAAEWRTSQQFNQNIRRLLWTQLIIGFVIEGGILPVLFNLYLLRLDFGPEAIGSINSAGLIVFTICTLPAGEIGKRIGVRSALLWGMTLMFAGFLYIPLSEFFPIAGTQPAFGPSLGNGILHVGLALFFVNNPPFIMQNTANDAHNSVFGLQSSVLALSGFVGSLAAGLIPLIFISVLNLTDADPAPIRYTLILGAFSLLIATWIIRSAQTGQSLRTPSVQKDEAKKAVNVEEKPADQRVFTIGRAFWIWLIVISLGRYLVKMGVGANSLFYNIYLDDGLGVSTAMIGNFSALGHLLAIPGGLFVPYVLKRFGSKKSVVLISTALAFTLVLMLFPVGWVVGLGHAVTAAFGPLRFGIYTIYILDRTPTEQQPFVSGLQELIIGAAFATTAIFGGYLIAWRSYSFLYLVSIGLSLLGALLLWAFLYGPFARKKLEAS